MIICLSEFFTRVLGLKIWLTTRKECEVSSHSLGWLPVTSPVVKELSVWISEKKVLPFSIQINTHLSPFHIPKNTKIYFFSLGSVMKLAAHVWMKIINTRMSFTCCAHTSFCQILHVSMMKKGEGKKYQLLTNFFAIPEGWMRSRSMESGLSDCQEHWHKRVEGVQSGSDLCSERLVLRSLTLSDSCGCTTPPAINVCMHSYDSSPCKIFTGNLCIYI